MGVGTGFFGPAPAAVASAASDDGAACPAYPWRNDGTAQGGRKVFMQSDCAACHSMLPYAGIREVPPAEAEPKVAEIVVVVNDEQPATPRSATTYTYTPLTTQMLHLSNLYSVHQLKNKMPLPTPVWLKFLQPYIGASHTA